MKIKRLVVGYLQTNCYIISFNNDVYVVDPGDEFDKIYNEIKDLNVTGILVTHNHSDHVGALQELENKLGLKANENIDSNEIEVISTPGHTADSKTFYFKRFNTMFTGDFIFYNSIGRMDLPTGSEEDMQKSLGKISDYSDDVDIYPGHGDKTILGIEKIRFNYYFM